MRLHFVDINPAVADALATSFAGHSEVQVQCADILALASHCVVSPANSFGYMDGGIDAAYSQFFGPSLQVAVQTAIHRRPEGMLPVGAALAVMTQNEKVPYMIVAPTMEVPEEVPASHAGRALRAVLRLIDLEPCLGRDVFCPGLATHTGRVPPADAAAAMLSAYEHWLQTHASKQTVTEN
jgi:O-acetyl-ADP-ribose deacetylase (regulator of RNase III)